MILLLSLELVTLIISSIITINSNMNLKLIIPHKGYKCNIDENKVLNEEIKKIKKLNFKDLLYIVPIINLKYAINKSQKIKNNLNKKIDLMMKDNDLKKLTHNERILLEENRNKFSKVKFYNLIVENNKKEKEKTVFKKDKNKLIKLIDHDLISATITSKDSNKPKVYTKKITNGKNCQ